MALLEHFFPGSPVEIPHTILLPFIDVLELEPVEISWVLARSSPSLAPGPDKAQLRLETH